jgi:hypothetical protein
LEAGHLGSNTCACGQESSSHSVLQQTLQQAMNACGDQ